MSDGWAGLDKPASVPWLDTSDGAATGMEYKTVKCPRSYNALQPTKKSSESKLLVRNL